MALSNGFQASKQIWSRWVWSRALSKVAEEGLAGHEALSGRPKVARAKLATIFSPARTASQQGLGSTLFSGNPAWRIEFEPEAKWENPLMGWTSTGDSLENIARMTLPFDSKEAAIEFCKRQGFEYTVREPNVPSRVRTQRFASYGDNFSTKRAGLPQGGLISETMKVKAEPETSKAEKKPSKKKSKAKK